MLLSPQEIKSIEALLLSPDSSNIVLGITLLQEQPAAVQELLIPLEIALTYSEHKQAVTALLKRHTHQVSWRQLPLYAFYNTIAEPQAQAEHRPTIRRFIRQEEQYRPYLLTQPRSAILYVDGATFISSEEEFVATAHNFYALALANLPQDSYLYYNYADLLRQHPPNNQPLSALRSPIVSYYKKAYQLKKERHILSRLANFYAHDLKDVAAARQTWQWCLEEHPKYGTAWVSLAQLEVEEEAWTVAQQLLKKTVDLQATGTWVDLDQVYYLLGLVAWKGASNLDIASQYFEQALQENKYYAAPLEALLELSVATHQYQQAIRWHRLALELQPMNIFLLLKLAQLYLKTENYEQAAATYREILNLNPDYRPALEGLAQLKDF